MHQSLKRFWHTVCEYVTHWMVAGAILAATGAAPDHWLAHLFEQLHLPADALHLWVANIDLRIIFASMGFLLIGADIGWRMYRKLAPASAVARSTAVPETGAVAAKDEALPLPGDSSIQPSAIVHGEILTLPDKPSIVVLPFTNMSGDPEQEYFADGITEDIITELSRFSELFVIARNSSFQYKGKSPDVRQIGRELGVRYVLEGSIRRAGDRVRITGQLVDATTGTHRWADRYDRKLEDIFSVQDEVARTIVTILASHVNKAEIERTLLKPPRTWQAHDCYMKATSAFGSYWTSLNVEDLYETRRFLEQALSIDPNYARAHALLTFTYTTAWVQPLDASYGDPGTLSRALQSGRKAVQLDPFLPAAHAYLAIVLTFSGQHEASIAEHERAIALNPNFSDWTFGADVLKAGDPARAIELLQKHMRLDPFYVPQALAYLGLAHYMLKQYAKAIPPLRETASRAPNYWRCRAWLTAAYAQSGAVNEARVEAAELLRLRPKFTASGDLTFYSTIKRREDVEHLVEGLRKAGLPE